MTECGGKGQAAAPIGGVGNLPTADQEIGSAADVAHVFLSPSHWQLVNGADHEYVVAAEVIRTVGEAGIKRIV